MSPHAVTHDRKLLVKVVKANGLVGQDFGAAGGCDPYCTVSIDEPAQQQSTSVVKNTSNPFFDEHFLFNIGNNSRHVKFEVFDRRSTKTGTVSEFLGRALVTMEEIRRVPGNRQIIPLTPGRSGSSTSTSGSVTVELVMMDMVSESLSSPPGETMTTTPYRCIETSRSVMPGGTLVTTTTTTTDRLKEVHGSPRYNESPVRVEKSIGSNMNHDGRDVGGTDRMTDVVMQELSGQQRAVHARTTTVTVLGKPKEQTIPLITTADVTRDADVVRQQNSTDTKKMSLSSMLRRRFGRGKKNTRAQSAERFPPYDDSNLLRPPDFADSTASTPRISDGDLSSSTRKSRSQSLSASFRNLFHRSKRTGGDAVSRESSVSRAGRVGTAGLRDKAAPGTTPSPQLSRSYDSRHGTPDYMPHSYQLYAGNAGDSSTPAAKPSPLR